MNFHQTVPWCCSAVKYHTYIMLRRYAAKKSYSFLFSFSHWYFWNSKTCRIFQKVIQFSLKISCKLGENASNTSIILYKSSSYDLWNWNSHEDLLFNCLDVLLFINLLESSNQRENSKEHLDILVKITLNFSGVMQR